MEWSEKFPYIFDDINKRAGSVAPRSARRKWPGGGGVCFLMTRSGSCLTLNSPAGTCPGAAFKGRFCTARRAKTSFPVKAGIQMFELNEV